MESAWRSVRFGLIYATSPHPLWGPLESPSEVSQVVQLPCPTLGVVGGFFHNDHSDQAHLSQNGDILLKCTLQTYSCFPASFQAKRKCQQVTRKVLRIKHIIYSTPQQQKHPFVLWSGCQFVQPWPVGRWCQDPKKSKVWSLQMDQIPANPKGAIWKGPKP